MQFFAEGYVNNNDATKYDDFEVASNFYEGGITASHIDLENITPLETEKLCEGSVTDLTNIVMKEKFDALKKIGKCIELSQSFDKIWENIIPQSIDYGLMEKADNIYVIPAEFDWNDIGSWDALYEIFSKNEGDNVIRGLGRVLDGKGNLVQSNGKFTAVIGLDNIVVVNTKDATLIVHRDKVEKVKDLVSWIEKKNHKDLL